MSLWTRDPDPAARLRILCFPSAGGGTVEYRRWRVPADVQVLPVVLPGRESRLGERPIEDMDALIDALVAGLEPALDRPYAVFGHSMGAWVGFELIRALRRRSARLPVRLFASGRRAPDLPDRFGPLHTLPSDDVFLEVLQERYNAIPQQLLAQREILDLFLPSLRADFRLIERYAYRVETPLPVPISAWAGARDRVVDKGELQGWSAHTAANFQLRLFPGGHFYLRDEPEELVESILGAVG